MELNDKCLYVYGIPVKSYSGVEGKIITSGIEYIGPFLVGQLANGKIILIINIKLNPGQGLSFPLDYKNSKFEGFTEDGWHIESGEISHQINNLTESHHDLTCNVYVIRNLYVTKKNSNIFPCICETIVTNYLFNGDAPEFSKISIDNPFFNPILIQKLPEYEDSQVTIQALNDNRPTVKLSYKINKSEDLAQIEDFLNYICMLLSISRGTHVQWLYYIIKDMDRIGFTIIHKALITRSYSGCISIPISIENGHRNKEFLTNSIKNYQKYLQNTRALTSLVNGFLASRVNDFIEKKGMAAAIEFELIKEYALYISKMEISPNNVDDDGQASILYKNIKDAIKQSFPEKKDKETRANFYQNIKCLNHVPFRFLLERVIIELGIPLTDELDLVKDSRDNLIHTGHFYCINEAKKNGNEVTINDCYLEYTKVLKLLDKIILKLFETDLLLE